MPVLAYHDKKGSHQTKREEIILRGTRVALQSDAWNVNLDDLMLQLKTLADEVAKLSQGINKLSVAGNLTGPAINPTPFVSAAAEINKMKR